jgi:hypothetical protein
MSHIEFLILVLVLLWMYWRLKLLKDLGFQMHLQKRQLDRIERRVHVLVEKFPEDLRKVEGWEEKNGLHELF